jgi:hypothetical protein
MKKLGIDDDDQWTNKNKHNPDGLSNGIYNSTFKFNQLLSKKVVYVFCAWKIEKLFGKEEFI